MNRLLALLRWLVRMEVDVWVSLWRWVTRKRPGMAPGDTAWSYVGISRPAIWAFIVGSTIEVVAVHLMTARWPWVQIPMFILGTWGLLWMFGLLGSFTAYPHLTGPDGVRLRHGRGISLLVPWGNVAGVKPVRHDYEGIRQVHPFEGGIALTQLAQTNVEITLAEPMVVRRHSGDVTVEVVRVYADDARGFVAALRAGATRT